MKKLKIALLIPSLECGGAERSASILINRLAENENHSIILYTLSNATPFYTLHPDIKHINIDSKISSSSFFMKNLQRVKLLKKLNKRMEVSLIIGYTSLSAVLVCMASIGERIKCIICERSNPANTDITQKIARIPLYSRSNGAVFQTEHAKSYFNKQIKNSIVIPNFIEVKKLPDFIPLNNREKKITSVGRLVESKNHIMLISAFSLINKEFSDFRIEIYGEGPMRESLTSHIRSLNLEKQVFLMGETEGIFNSIKTSSLFVFTSKYEGFPNALLESVSLGVPSLATDAPGYAPRELFREFEFGELVELNNVEELSLKIKRMLLMKLDEKKLESETISIRDKYDVNSLMNRWEQYVEEILGGEPLR